MKIDFLEDWYEFAHSCLKAGGYENIPVGKDCSRAFFEVNRRLVPRIPRRVEVAPEFVVPHALATGFDILQRKVERGDDLTPHMSRKIQNAKATDMFLNDWGIHHFHLGTKADPKKPKLFQGTKQLALAWVDSNAAYFIKVGVHGRDVGNATWGDAELLEIVDRRWPHLLVPFELHNCLPLEQSRTPDEVVAMRRFLTILKLSSGRVVAPPGGGNAGASGSVAALREHNRVMNTIVWAQKWCEENAQLFLDECSRTGNGLTKPIRLHLVIGRELSTRIEARDANGVRVLWEDLKNILLSDSD